MAVLASPAREPSAAVAQVQSAALPVTGFREDVL